MDYRILVVLESGEEKILNATSYFEAEYIRDQAVAGAFWANVKAANVQVKCEHHGWSATYWGYCATCEEEQEWREELELDVL